MLRTLTSRLAVTSLLTLTGCLSLNAQAQAPAATQINFSVADGLTVLKSLWPVIPVKATITDPAGIQSVGINSKVGSGGGQLNGATKGSVCVYFFAGYYKTGDYTFTANVTNSKLVTTTKTITVHVN